MAGRKTYEMDMCSGSILKKMLVFALPLMCTSILQLLFNAADIIVVGRYAGDNSLAAVGSNSSLINLMVNFFMGLSIGANVVVARYYGAKQDKELSETIHTAMLVSLACGLFLMVVVLIGARQILIWMKTPENVINLAVLYLRIYAIGMAASMSYNFGSAILRAVGDTRRPLIYLSFAGVINVLLNLFFVIVLKMDVAGVATATIISQFISAFLVWRCMLKGEGSIKLEFSKLKFSPGKFMDIFRIGFPASLQSMMFNIANVTLQSSVNSFGEIVLAGNSAAANIEGFVYMGTNAFYQATISFTGQNVGAGRYERVNKILYAAEFYTISIGLVLCRLSVHFGHSLLGLYSDSTAVIEAGMVRMRLVAGTYVLCGMMDAIVGSLRGMGHAVKPMFVTLVGVCGVRMIWILTFFQMERFHTTASLYATYPASWLVTFFAQLILFIFVRKKMKQSWGV